MRYYLLLLFQIYICILAFVVTGCSSSLVSNTVKSPDGKLEFTIYKSEKVNLFMLLKLIINS